MTRFAHHLHASRPEDRAAIADADREHTRVERGRTLFVRMAEAGENDRRRAAAIARRESLEAFDELRAKLQRRHHRGVMMAQVLTVVAVVALLLVAFAGVAR